MPDQRTIIVLGSLVAAMTVVSALLLMLEPGPVVAPLSGVTLQSIERGEVDPAQKLFDTARPRPWRAIVVRDSGTLAGSARSLDALHEQLGRGGLGYHFVINNGNNQHGKPDGLIEVGYRWKQQGDGAYYTGEGAEAYHQQAIGICFVGNTDRTGPTEAQLRELTWLVRQLQERFDIPREAVLVDVGSGHPGDATDRFPHARFRQQLVNFDLP